jgi:hypothetical protein
MAHDGPMHWRGDRTGGHVPAIRALDEELAFKAFNVAFRACSAATRRDPDADMQAFTDFILTIQPPPNPCARSTTTHRGQRRGRDCSSAGRPTIAECDGCHLLDASRASSAAAADDLRERDAGVQGPALSNAYQKIGMFGMPNVPFVNLPRRVQHQGEQVRGFGFLHDGSIATVFDFLHASVFGTSESERHDSRAVRAAVRHHLRADRRAAGTLRADSAAGVGARVDLLTARARTSFVLVDQPDARECDLVAHGVVDGAARGYPARRDDRPLPPGPRRRSAARVDGPARAGADRRPGGDVHLRAAGRGPPSRPRSRWRRLLRPRRARRRLGPRRSREHAERLDDADANRHAGHDVHAHHDDDGGAAARLPRRLQRRLGDHDRRDDPEV